MVAGSMVARARALSERAHAGQVDKAGRPYIAHPARVAAAVAAQRGERDPAVAVAWLHDVVEDTGCTLEEIEQQFGAGVAAAVDAVTRRAGELPEEYYHRVASNEVARVVKLADIADNTDPLRLAQLSVDETTRLRGKYAYARAQLDVQSEY